MLTHNIGDCIQNARKHIAETGEGQLLSVERRKGTLPLTSEAASDASKLPYYRINDAQGAYSPLFRNHAGVLQKNGTVYDPTLGRTFNSVNSYRKYLVGNSKVTTMVNGAVVR